MASTLHAEPQLAVSREQARETELVIEVRDLMTEINNPISTFRSEWQALFDHDPQASIFQHPDFVRCELGYLPPSKLPCLMLVARQGGKLVGYGTLLPKVSHSKKVGGIGLGWNIHGYRLVGNRFLSNGDFQTEQKLLEAAVQQVRVRKARFLLLEDLEEQTPLLKQVEGLTSLGFRLYSPTAIQVRLKIQLPATANEYWAKFTSKTRSGLRRLERKLGDFRVVVSTSVDQVADFLRDAHQVSLQTWQTEQLGLRIKDDPATLDLYTFLASQQAFRSYLMYFGDKPVAFVMGTQFRDIFRYDEVGFDRQYHALSPGRVLLVKILDDLFDRDKPLCFDFGMGDAEYKRTFANQEGKAGNVWIVPPGLRGRWLVTYLNGSRNARKFGRDLVKSLGWYHRLRQKSRLGAAVDVQAKGHTATAEENQSQGE